MRSRLGMKMVPKLVFAFVLIAVMVSVAYAPVLPAVPYTLLWSDPVNTHDIALSRNGQYVASVAGGQVRFYGRSSSTPLWTTPTIDQEYYESVAISADGNSVAAGGDSQLHFWANARSLTGNPPATWTSFHGPIMPRCIAISDDGNYLVACGSGLNVFYWAGANGKSGPNVATTWVGNVAGLFINAIDISSDGDYVVAGFSTVGNNNVAYWKGARTLSGTQAYARDSTEPDATVVAVAVSDDGNYVAAATETDFSIHYWAGARTLSGNPSSMWLGGPGVSFTSLDMSSDGNSVIAGAGAGVYFWGGARTLTGKPQNPSWIYPTSTVSEVAIDDAGDYMVAANSVEPPHIVYFLDSSGNAKWTYQVDLHVNALSISSDGGTLAVGTEPWRTAYLFDTGFPIHVVGTPVGGFMEPVNNLAVAAPYLALFGLVAAVAIVVVKPWKKREN